MMSLLSSLTSVILSFFFLSPAKSLSVLFTLLPTFKITSTVIISLPFLLGLISLSRESLWLVGSQYAPAPDC